MNASDANIDLVECDLGKEKVLGMIWNHDKDHIHFDAKLNFSRRVAKVHLEPDLILENLPQGIHNIP